MYWNKTSQCSENWDKTKYNKKKRKMFWSDNNLFKVWKIKRQFSHNYSCLKYCKKKSKKKERREKVFIKCWPNIVNIKIAIKKKDKWEKSEIWPKIWNEKLFPIKDTFINIELEVNKHFSQFTKNILTFRRTFYK